MLGVLSVSLPKQQIYWGGSIRTGKKKRKISTHVCSVIYITLLTSLYGSVIFLCLSVLQVFKFSSYRNIFIVHTHSEKFKVHSHQHFTQMIWHRGHRYHSYAAIQLAWFLITVLLLPFQKKLAETKLLSKPLCCSELFYCSRLWERSKIQVTRWVIFFNCLMIIYSVLFWSWQVLEGLSRIVYVRSF